MVIFLWIFKPGLFSIPAASEVCMFGVMTVPYTPHNVVWLNVVFERSNRTTYVAIRHLMRCNVFKRDRLMKCCRWLEQRDTWRNLIGRTESQWNEYSRRIDTSVYYEFASTWYVRIHKRFVYVLCSYANINNFHTVDALTFLYFFSYTLDCFAFMT